jgi:hypothetical protein
MKTWYTSKTLWLNIIAVIALLLQTQYGFVLDPEAQAGALAIINLILRLVTGAPLVWNAAPADQPPADGGFIRLPLLFLLCVFALVITLTGGCASTAPTAPPIANDSPQVIAGKSLLAVKSSIVAAATATAALCKSGVMPADQCAQAKAAYELAKPAYDAAVDAYLLTVSTGGDPGDFGRSMQRVQALAATLLALSGGAH